jgi:hypothetical protein
MIVALALSALIGLSLAFELRKYLAFLPMVIVIRLSFMKL